MHGRGINKLAKTDDTRLGRNHFRIYAHGARDGGISFSFPSGKDYDYTAYTPKQIIRQLSRTSAQFRDKMNNKEDITIAFMICNVRTGKTDLGLVKTAMKITEQYANIKKITVGSGYQIVSYDELSAIYEYDDDYIDSFGSADPITGRRGGELTVINGKITNFDNSKGHIHVDLTDQERAEMWKNKQQNDDPNDDYINTNKTWLTQ